jgi:hypothetical protein
VLLGVEFLGCIKPMPDPYIIDDKYVGFFAKRGVSSDKLSFPKHHNFSALPQYLTRDQSRVIFESFMLIRHISASELPKDSVSYDFFSKRKKSC